MIGLLLSGALSKVLAFFRSLSPMAAALALLGVFAAVQSYRAHSLSGQLERAIAAGSKLITDTRTATLRSVAQTTGRMITEANTRAKINEESANEANARNVALAARYDSLWAAYSSRGGTSGRTLPLPDPAKGFDAAACGEGLLSIPAETAFGLMKAADENTDRLIALQAWAEKQAAVDPNLDPKESK